MTRVLACELGGVCHRLSDAFTLQIESLEIVEGETLCLVGPTGAGKSTLLRLCSGQEPVEGRLCLLGQTRGANGFSLEVTRQVVTVHQRPMLLSRSVRANIEYGLHVRGASRIRERVDELLHIMGLTSLANQDARTLSGGQMQLVGLARALVVEPRMLLLDEPTAHLDPASVGLVESLIRRQQERTSMTVVWATHHLFQARRAASRIALILNGQLVEMAPTDDFFERPRDERTDAFVQGKMVY
jgi:tungstate transport system ATP-binding protein